MPSDKESLIDMLSDESCWNSFYNYKASLALPKAFEKELKGFIDEKKYLPVVRRINDGDSFPLPKKSVISKLSSQKKRTVYTYPADENIVLKLLTYLVLRRYDYLFCDNLYSFRPGLNAKDAIRKLSSIEEISGMYSYKVDISNYFNSIPVPKLLPMLDEVLGDDPKLLKFLRSLLEETNVLDRGVVTTDTKGIMAGTPMSSFYANLYLRGLDRYFADRDIPYARYSDDIILFAKSRGEIDRHAAFIKRYLSDYGLLINPDKEFYSEPSKQWTFLGFSFKENTIDIAPATVKKLKQKMRRKANALMRWSTRNNLSGEKAATAFIRIFNRKLLESSDDNDLTWSYWFFSVINTTEGLHTIDEYAQDCIRYLVSGKHTKSRYNVRYDDIKKLGYKSLVHAYYNFNKDKK